MKRFKQPELHFDEQELKTNLGEGNFIFVGSSCDMFAEEISREWIVDTLEHCEKYPQNKYLFQSKNPERFNDFNIPKKTILCTTIETNKQSLLNKYSSPISFIERIHDLLRIAQTTKIPVMVTIEPIMDFNLWDMFSWLGDRLISQINIGANTNPAIKLPEPPKEKILKLISALEKITTVHLKPNLDRLIK